MYRSCFSNKCIFSVRSILDTGLFYTSKVTTLSLDSQKRTCSLNIINNEKWDLLSAVCVERRPVITKPFNQLEKKVNRILNEIEEDRSHKSNHEIRGELEKATALAKELDFDSDDRSQQTAQDFEDAAQEEYKQFKFACRTTVADEKNDTKSVERKLDLTLVLLVKEKLGNDLYWIFPQGIRREGETMRQTAERILEENCGDQLKTVFLGNAPCGFYKYKYPKDVRQSSETVGAKIFFFKAFLVGGNVKKGSFTDYQWLTQKELDILHEDYKKSVDMFIISDS